MSSFIDTFPKLQTLTQFLPPPSVLRPLCPVDLSSEPLHHSVLVSRDTDRTFRKLYHCRSLLAVVWTVRVQIWASTTTTRVIVTIHPLTVRNRLSTRAVFPTNVNSRSVETLAVKTTVGTLPPPSSWQLRLAPPPISLELPIGPTPNLPLLFLIYATPSPRDLLPVRSLLTLV